MNEILRALDDYYEASQELAQRQSEYTGYSPSWALHSWIECKEKAMERLSAALSCGGAFKSIGDIGNNVKVYVLMKGLAT